MRAGIAGFVDGVFKGMDWREARDARKRQREIADEVHGWNKQDHEWNLETRDYTREERKRKRSAEDQALADEARLRAAREATVDGMFGGGEGAVPAEAPASHGEAPRENARNPREISVMDGRGDLSFGTPSVVEPGNVVMSTKTPAVMAPSVGVGALGNAGQVADAAGRGVSVAPAAAPTAPAALPQYVAPERRPIAGDIGALEQQLIAAGGVSRDAQMPVDRTPAALNPAPTGNPPPAPAPRQPLSVREVDPSRSAAMQDFQGFMRNQDIAGATNAIGTMLIQGKDGGPQPSRSFGITDYFMSTPEQGDANAAIRSARADAAGWYRSDEARAFFTKNPDALEAAAQDPLRFYANLTQGPQPTEGFTPRAPAAAPTPAAPAPGAQPDPTPAPGAAAAPATQPVRGQTPLSFGVVGKGAPVKTTPARLQRAAETATKRFYDTEVTEWERELMRQGKLSEAKGVREWFSNEKVRAGARDFFAFLEAYRVGDEAAAARHAVATYNNEDYYGDGYTVEPDSVTFSDGPGGERLVTWTVKNATTGETFTQTLDQMDLYQKFMERMNPAQALTDQYSAMVEARKSELELAKEAAKAAIESGKMSLDDAMTTVKKWVETASESAGLNLDSLQSLTMPQILTLAQLIRANPNPSAADVEAIISGPAQTGADPTGGYRR